MQRKGAKLNVNFNNTKEAEAPGGNYVVEFNNQKEVIKKVIIEQSISKIKLLRNILEYSAHSDHSNKEKEKIRIKIKKINNSEK